MTRVMFVGKNEVSNLLVPYIVMPRNLVLSLLRKCLPLRRLVRKKYANFLKSPIVVKFG